MSKLEIFIKMRKIHRLAALFLVMSILTLLLAGCSDVASTPTNTAIQITTVAATTPTTTQTVVPTTQAASSKAAPTIATTDAVAASAAVINSPTLAQSGPASSVTQSASTVVPTTPKPTANPQGFVPGSFKRVFTIILENTNYDTTLANSYMAELAKSGTLLTNYFAISHPSYPNYLALTGGSTFGQTDDGQTDLDKTNLADLMEAAGISWKVYAEGLPKPCFLGVQAGDYVRKHVPFASYVNIQKNPTRCNKLVNAEQLKSDVAADKLPQYSMYIPDQADDGHDTGVKFAADWLKNFLTPLLDNPKFMQDTLIVVTFDEDHGDSRNHIYTALLGQSVKAGATNNTRYDHYSLLRTIEDNFGLGNLGREDAKATDIVSVWK